MSESAGRLHNRRLAVGITGSIAAYKAVELVRMFQNEGADVRVLMTTSAVEFIGPLTLETLSHHPVDTDVLSLRGDGRIGHIAAAHDVEAIVVAPATAHWLGAMANGMPGDTITAACLATSVPVIVAPAMDGGMYAHPATQANVARLRQFGYRIVEPEAARAGSRHSTASSTPLSRRLAAPRLPLRGPVRGRPPLSPWTSRLPCRCGPTSPVAMWSSPPAVRPSRSTPSASWATVRPARWASPSPRTRSIVARP